MRRSNRIPTNASPFQSSEAIARGFDALHTQIRELQAGVGNGPGCSFALPFKLVAADGGVWTFSENGGGSLVVTGPASTVTVIAPP